jgi:hypothetical protein
MRQIKKIGIDNNSCAFGFPLYALQLWCHCYFDISNLFFPRLLSISILESSIAGHLRSKHQVSTTLYRAAAEGSNTLCRIIVALHYFLLKDKTELSPAQKAEL